MRFNNLRRNELILEKGTICCNCHTDQKDTIQFHHIVPLSIGGNDCSSNIVPLCDNCHNLIHHNITKNGSYNHSSLIKKGIQKAKEQGKIVGRRKTTIENIPEKFKNFYYPQIKNKSMSIMEASHQTKMSRTTIYKYIAIIENKVK